MPWLKGISFASSTQTKITNEIYCTRGYAYYSSFVRSAVDPLSVKEKRELCGGDVTPGKTHASEAYVKFSNRGTSSCLLKQDMIIFAPILRPKDLDPNTVVHIEACELVTLKNLSRGILCDVYRAVAHSAIPGLSNLQIRARRRGNRTSLLLRSIHRLQKVTEAM